MIHTIEGQPEVGSPYTKVFIIMTNINTKATKQNSKPITEDMINGVVENAVIPSIAYLNNFQNDHLVSPATLSTFSYSNHLVLNPTKLKIPFE